MRATPAIPLLCLALVSPLAAPERPPPARDEAPPSPPAPAESPQAAEGPQIDAARADPYAPLEEGERRTLLRLSWRTLTGHLTGRPIQDQDLEAFDLTPALMARRGCWVTVKKGGEIRGSQGEIEPTRPLYQQIIVFTRRAATRDARFVPMTELDLEATTIEIAIIGHRERVDGPGSIRIDRDGVFLEKWGRRAALLPGLAAAQGWTAERTLDELCRQASLPKGAWSRSARIEVFAAETIAGGPPPPEEPPPAPAEGVPSREVLPAQRRLSYDSGMI